MPIIDKKMTVQNGIGLSIIRLKRVNSFVFLYISGLLMNTKTFTPIAIAHTTISDETILIPVINLIGKSIRIPASAIGVQRTKNDQVIIPIKKPPFIP